jgi:hypothetical protein
MGGRGVEVGLGERGGRGGGGGDEKSGGAEEEVDMLGRCVRGAAEVGEAPSGARRETVAPAREDSEMVGRDDDW